MADAPIAWRRFERTAPWLLWAGLVCYVAACWDGAIGDHVFSPLGASALHGDSPSFFWQGPAFRYRWVGYPLFLAAVEAVFGTLTVVPKAQLVLLAAAFAFLCHSVGKALRSPLLALALAVVLLAQCAVARLHAYFLSEALFVPLLCVLMGALARCVERPNVPALATATFACGLAIAVRPAGLGLLAIWPLFLWLVWPRCGGRRGRLLAATVLPLVSVFLIEGAVWRHVHTGVDARPSIAERALLGKALLLEAEPRAPGRMAPDLAAFMVEARRVAAPLRDVIAGAPDWRSRALLLRNAESAVEVPMYQRVLRPRLRQLAARRGEDVDQLVGELGWSGVTGAPLAWLRNAATHFLAMWCYYSINDQAFVDRYVEYASARAADLGPDTAREAKVAPAVATAYPAAVVWISRAASAAGLLASLAALTAVWQRAGRGREFLDGALVVGVVAACAAHAYVTVCALFNNGHLRFIATTWPLQGICCLLVGRWIWLRWRHRFAFLSRSIAGGWRTREAAR